MKISLKQKLNIIEQYNLMNANFSLSNKPIKRINQTVKNSSNKNKLEKLNNLKKK